MYNKKVLIDSLKKLGSAKAPVQKKDMIIDPMGQSMYPGQEYGFPRAAYSNDYSQMKSNKLDKKQLGGLTRFTGMGGRMMGLPPAVTHISNIAPKVDLIPEIIPDIIPEIDDRVKSNLVWGFDDYTGGDPINLPGISNFIGRGIASPTDLTKYLGDFDFKDFSDGWEVRNQMMNAFDGPQWASGKNDFYTVDELSNLINKQQSYLNDRAAFNEMYPEDPGMMIFNKLRGDTSRDELFSNLFPNSGIQNFKQKFYSPELINLMKNTSRNEQGQNLYDTLISGTNFNNNELLNKSFLKSLTKGEDTLPRTYKDLLKSQKDNYFAKAPARDVVMEMRGTLGLKLEDVLNATPEQFEKWRQQILKKKNIQLLDRWNRDIEKPFKGSDAWREISKQPGYKNQYGGSSKGLSVKQSNIEGADKGLFSEKGFKKNQLVGLAHRDGQPVGHIGNMHNHSNEPNMYSIKKGNERYVYAIRDIEPGEELTTDYRQQPELEQPEDFMKKGGSTPKLPRKKNSKGYSRNLEATNRLFAEHPFFAKSKSRKNKIYDPRAQYYDEGGLVQYAPGGASADPPDWFTKKGANMYFNPAYQNNFTGSTNRFDSYTDGFPIYKVNPSAVLGIEGSLSKGRDASKEAGRGWTYNAYAGLPYDSFKKKNFTPSAGVMFDYENSPQDKAFRPQAQLAAEYNPTDGFSISGTTGARFPLTPYGNKRVKPGYGVGHLDIYGGGRFGLIDRQNTSAGMIYGARVHGKYMPKWLNKLSKGSYFYGDAGLQFDPVKGKGSQKDTDLSLPGAIDYSGQQLYTSGKEKDPGTKWGATAYANVGIKKEIDDIKFSKDKRAKKIQEIEDEEKRAEQENYRKEEPVIEKPKKACPEGQERYCEDCPCEPIERVSHPRWLQEGGESGCPEGYALNPKTGECIEWNPRIVESNDDPTSYNPINDTIYMNSSDRPEGMSDEDYNRMYQDQLEHEQLHRLQWINDELRGVSKIPLRMPSPADNQDYDGPHYYNRRQEEVDYLHNYWKNHHPHEAEFMPDNLIYDKETNPAMYEIPWTVEGEARDYEHATHDGMNSFFPKKQNGGYIDAELTPEEIEEYAKGGYIIEDISIPSLNKAKKGGPPVSRLTKGLRKSSTRTNIPSSMNYGPYVTFDYARGIGRPSLTTPSTTGVQNVSTAISPEIQTKIKKIDELALSDVPNFLKSYNQEDFIDQLEYPLTIDTPSGHLEIKPNTGNINDNLWHFGAFISNPREAGLAFSYANKLLPIAKPSILEKTSLSADSWNMLANMGRRDDWDMEFAGMIPMNQFAKHSTVFEGLPPLRHFGGMDMEKSLGEEYLKRLNDMIAAKGLTEKATVDFTPLRPDYGYHKFYLPNYKLTRKYSEGGDFEYQLGDEVDETTMKELKKLGYTFEKI
jgi:hypothetical protein